MVLEEYPTSPPCRGCEQQSQHRRAIYLASTEQIVMLLEACKFKTYCHARPKTISIRALFLPMDLHPFPSCVRSALSSYWDDRLGLLRPRQVRMGRSAPIKRCWQWRRMKTLHTYKRGGGRNGSAAAEEALGL